jgi:hypothetical protein
MRYTEMGMTDSLCEKKDEIITGHYTKDRYSRNKKVCTDIKSGVYDTEGKINLT